MKRVPKPKPKPKPSNGTELVSTVAPVESTSQQSIVISDHGSVSTGPMDPSGKIHTWNHIWGYENKVITGLLVHCFEDIQTRIV